MATIIAPNNQSVYSIKRFSGVNECADGDTSLQMGEAAEMRNFRITLDGHLQKRPGYKTVIDLEAPCFGLWTGAVNGNVYTLAAAGGKIYKLDITAKTKTEIGTVTSGSKVTFFPFGGKVYILDGAEYRSWDGTAYAVVAGYVPCVYTATPPAGGGTQYEQVNKLTAKKSQKFSADGTATAYQLVEKNIASIDKVTIGGTETTAYTADLTNGKVTFTTAPATGINNVQIWWTGKTAYRTDVAAMRYAEQYNGTTDNRVFLYGDGTNKTIYSGIDGDGNPTAEYFPDLNVMEAGDANAPITGMIRQFSRLIVFKTDSAYSVYYSTLMLAGGTVTAGFYITPVNRNIGNEAPGGVQLVNNYPRTLHGGGVYEWHNGKYGLTSDERQAKRISKRIEDTLSDFTLADCVTFENEYNQDYYIVCGGTAVIHNYTEDAWFIYTNFPATAFTMVGNEMYICTDTGLFCRVSGEYMSDNGSAIDCYWCSGSMAFQQEWKYKYSTMLWVGIKPESQARVTVTAQSDRMAGNTSKIVASSLSTFDNLNFSHFSFNTSRRARVYRERIKIKKFALYHLVFENNSANSRCTILETDIMVVYNGNVK